MIQNSDYCPLRLQSNSLVLEELPNELMVYDPERKKAFCLNETAAFVWRHADGKTSVAEIARLLGAHLDRPINEQVVWYALETLSKDDLLSAETGLPQILPGVTRRALLQRLGLGAAVSVPLVTAMMVAPAKAHASSWTPPSDNLWGGNQHHHHHHHHHHHG